MSKLIMQARFDILTVTETTPTEWEVLGEVHDSSYENFNPSDVEIGDVFLDESPVDGTVNCYLIISVIIVDAITVKLRCIYNEEGTPYGIAGQPVPSQGVISKTTTSGFILAPSTGYGQVTETLKNHILNINMERITREWDVIDGGGF